MSGEKLALMVVSFALVIVTALLLQSNASFLGIASGFGAYKCFKLAKTK